MPTKMQERAVARQAVTDARAIAEKAAGERREMTSAERADFDAAMAKGRAAVDRISADDQILAFAKEISDQVGGDPLGGGGEFGAPTGRQVKSREWASNAAAKIRATGEQLGVKALTSGSIDVPSPISTGIIPKPDNPTRVIDLVLERERLTGNEFTYLRQTVRTNNAAPVPDLTAKPVSVYTFAEIEDRARVIAHLSEPVPERYFSDHAGLVQVLESEMYRGVNDALEAEVVNGTGTGEHMTGILATSGVVAVAYSSSVLQTLRKARTALQNLEETPTAYVLSPADAEGLDLAIGSDGHYLAETELGNIFGGLPRLVSKSVPAGTALLADWSMARLFVREDIRLDADRSGENFERNQVILRAEGRFGFALLRPQAFAIVDLAP